MKKGGASSSGTHIIFPSEDEFQVAEILVGLKAKMSFVDSLADSSWKRKRRRSCLEPLQRPHAVVDKDDGRTTTSPDSPFGFPPSDESDDFSNNTSTKRSKKNYSDMIQKLSQEKEFLQGKIENAKTYCTKLKAYNSEIKTIQQKVSSSRMNVGIEPSIANQRVEFTEPSNSGVGSVNRVGPIGFDLNVPAEEAFGFETESVVVVVDVNRERVNDDKRVRYAEARRMRKGIMRIKSTSKRNGV